MKGFLLGICISAIFYFAYQKFNTSTSNTEVEAKTILKSVEAISKLMVLEGNFTETYVYQEDSKVFFDLIPQKKKAIILLDAKVIIGYDLKKMVITIDKEKRKLIVKKLPEEEINIIPELKFYDIQTSSFTTFGKEDINKVQADAKSKIEHQIENSGLRQQAKQRLIENLNSLVNLTQAIGWDVEDETQSIDARLLHITD